MRDDQRVAGATLLGAVAGALVGYLFFTERGRRVRAEVEPLIDGVLDELERAQRTVERTRRVAREDIL